MKGTNILIVGGVAGGATAAARARRLSESASITVVERGPYVSYANCGLPYFVSGDISERSKLLLQTPEGFDRRYRVDVKLHTEALQIDRDGHKVLVRGPDGQVWLPYDKLVLAQGGTPILPPLPGADAPHVFKLWTVQDMDRLDAFLRDHQPKHALVAGGGFIGLEMAEAFAKRGVATTVVELQPQVMALMDAEFGQQVAAELRQHGVAVEVGVGLKAIDAANHTAELSDGRQLPADLVLFSVGVRPELALVRQAGLELGPSGGLQVDAFLQTSDPDIYAAGDMVEVLQRISGRLVRMPLAGPANRQGRIAASNALGVATPYHGALGTSVVKVFEATAAMTGLSEKAALQAGLDVGVANLHKDHHAGYYPGGQEMSLKIVYERGTGKLLGAQGFGRAGVDKRIDVLATALHGGMTVWDLAELDLAYAPPYSSANDPVNLLGFVAGNDLSGFAPLQTPGQLAALLQNPQVDTPPPLLLDVRSPRERSVGHLEGDVAIPIDELRARLSELPRDRKILVYCRSGFRGHLALRILRDHGFDDVANLTGGWLSLVLSPGLPLVVD